ncbi:uncharacterized protein LOC119838067 [Zerene cesonia]|uniref:uncharacterized protein LOC119838067 n=1 Tax=Zerene cesonia TaxID=33412 RepID=UPI0018E547AB|nr:uncharacterized protein LOC119838067 [Zerene cesonia]
MVLGVLAAVALAVLAPKYGAIGGPLQHLSPLPLSFVYFTAGRGRPQPARPRLYLLTAFHANVAAVALCAVTVNAMSLAVDRRVMEGAILASASGPCSWLSLALYSKVTPYLAICNYVASLLTVPLFHLLLCGKPPLPSLEELKWVVMTSFLPFLIGTCATKEETVSVWSKFSALMLVYLECCCLLVEAEGVLYVSDVVTTLVLVISWLITVAASSFLYSKCRILDSAEAQLLLLVAVPKSTQIDWITSTCPKLGLYRLPAVFLAPTQALLLSTISYDSSISKSLPT